MGVKKLKDRVFEPFTFTLCLNKWCRDSDEKRYTATLLMELVNEDEEMITYAGACTICGAQYNLIHMKEES